MTAHVFDELPQLLTGEADRATVDLVAVHLRTCDDCRDELIAALTAHAALMSASRYAIDVVRPAPLPTGPGASAGAESTTLPGPRADLSAVFAQVRAEVEGADHHDEVAGRRARRGRVGLIAAAAVVVLALGGGGAYLAERGGSTAPASRPLALQAFGQGTSPASATLIGNDQMRLNASSLPSLAAGNYYEVWLTNGARTAMAPVGVLDAARTARITVPATEMATYSAVEVSVQSTAGVGAYSGHSVLRGSYA